MNICLILLSICLQAAGSQVESAWLRLPMFLVAGAIGGFVALKADRYDLVAREVERRKAARGD